MRTLFASVVGLVLSVAGLAFGSESATTGVVALSWETMLTIYGPMAGIIIWFMDREKKRDAKEDERDKAFQDLIVKCSEVMATVNATLTEVRNDLNKHRQAIYQLRDETRGNTRIMVKE